MRQRFWHPLYLDPDFSSDPVRFARVAMEDLANGTSSWREFAGYNSVFANLRTPLHQLVGNGSKPSRKESGDGYTKLLTLPVDLDDYLRPPAFWAGMSSGRVLL